MKNAKVHLIYISIVLLLIVSYFCSIKLSVLEDWNFMVEILSNIIVAISATVVAVVAVMGVKTGFENWKRQKRTDVAHDLARSYLRAIYKVRDSLKIVRNPFITITEMEDALRKQGSDNETIEKDLKDNPKMNAAVYSSRWQKVSEALSDLEVEMREAEVLWGKEAVDIEKSFEEKVRKLRMEVWKHLRGSSTEETDRIIYDSGENDEFRKEIDESIKPVSQYLNRFLRIGDQITD